MDDIPKAPVEYLEVSLDNSSLDGSTGKNEFNTKKTVQNNAPLPFAVSPLFWPSIISANRITAKGDDVKAVYDVVLNMEGCGFDLIAGDTIGICPTNDPVEVDNLLQRLGLIDEKNSVCKVSIKTETTKKKPVVPSYIPAVSNLGNIFETCIDLHAVPKKLFIRALLEYTSVPEERTKLEELCSRKSEKYTEWISKGDASLSGLLSTCPSCQPPVSLLFEHLPRLQPRPYSIAHFDDGSDVYMHIVFSVVKYVSCGVEKTGVCTGWIERITAHLREPKEDTSSLCSEMVKLNIHGDNNKIIKIPVFLRKSSGFHIPENPSHPLIMIGPGVGIAPFMGFLQRREKQRKELDSMNIGQCWLFFGCRNPRRDFLFKDEITKYASNGTIDKLLVSHSRYPWQSVYVQDSIRYHCNEFCKLFLDEEGYIFVCGDAKNMAREVLGVIIDCVAKYRVISKTDARMLVMDLQAKGRYKEDAWTIQDDLVRMCSKVMADEKTKQIMDRAPPPEQRPICNLV